MTSNYRKSSHDDNSINDSSLSDAIADILNSSEDDMKPAKKLDKKSVTSNPSEVPHSNNMAEPKSNRHSVGDDDNESGTPPMPDVYLSSESLDLGASLASLSNSYEDRVRYEDDFEDHFETESNATDYDIPSICSSASPSTHDFSLMSDDDVLELGHVDYLEDVTYNFVAQTAPLDPSVGCNNAGGSQESPISSNNIQKLTPIAPKKAETNSVSQDIVSASENDSSVTSDLVQVQQTMENILTEVVANVEGSVIIKIEEEEHCTVAKETPVDDLNDLAISTKEGDISNDCIAPDTPITEYYSIDDDNLIGCDVPHNDHSAKSTNEADFSDETYDDASSISYPETTDTEDSSIDEKFLRHTDYSEEVKSCISQKFTEFLNDCENVSDDSDDTDVPASSCHVAKDDSTSISEKCSIAADSDDEPAADHLHVLRSTTSSFHVAKEDSTSASETSSIAEEILPAESDNDESVSYADCVEDMGTNISFSKNRSSTSFKNSTTQTSTTNKLMQIEPETINRVEPTTDLHMNKITAVEGASEQEAENTNSDDTSVFSSPSPSPPLPVLDKFTSSSTDSLTANSDIIKSKEVKLIEDERRQLQYHIKYLTYQCNYLHKANKSLTNEAESLRSKFYTLILDKEETAQAACANSMKQDDIIEALKKDVHWWTYETKYAEEAKESLSAEVEALKQTSVEQKSKEESLLEENAGMKEQLEKLASSSNDEIQEMQRTIDGHKRNAENLDQQNTTLKEQLKKVMMTSEEIEKLKSAIDELKGNNDNLTEQNVALEEQLEKVSSTSEEEIKALKSTAEDQKIIIDALQQDNKSLKVQVENVSLMYKEKVQKLESTVDEYKIIVNQLLNENSALKHQVEHAASPSEDEKRALKDMSSMTEELIDENSELKIILDRTTEEKKKSISDLDELAWKHMDLEEYNILLEDLLHESDREAAASRKDSDKINTALEMENILLRENFHHLQTQSRKERKSNYLFGSRKLKAIQDLERKLIEAKNKNNALNESLLALESEYDYIGFILNETQMKEESQRIKNEKLEQELDRSYRQELDLRKELAEMNNVLEDSKGTYLDYQELFSHTNKLQLQNATLQRYIEDRRFHSHTDTDNINYHDDDIIQGSVDTNNDDSIKFETFMTSTMSFPTPAHQETPSEIPEQVQRTPLATPPNETYAAAKWQESFKSMFENQSRQFASFQQQIMIEILDLQKQLSTKNNAVTAETLSCLEAATNSDEHLKLSERVTTLEDEITSLKRQINKLDKINTRNEELSKEKDSKVECLFGVVNAITANINKLKQEKDEWKSIASEHQSTIVQLKEQKTLTEEQYHQYKTKTDKLIDDMNTDLYNKGRELESVEHKLRMSNITASQVPKLEQHLEDAQNNIDSLSSQLDEKSKTCQRLQTEAVEADVVGLRQRYHNLTDELAEVEQQLKNVRQEKKVTAEKLAKANLTITQMKIDTDNLITENFKREMKPKTGVWAGDTDKAHGEGELVKLPKRLGLNKTAPEAWSRANIMVVSKDGMLKTMFDEQEQRIKVFVQNSLKSSLKRSTNQIDNLRQKFHQLIQEAAEPRFTQSESDKHTDNDLNETMSDISSTSCRTAQDAVASVSDVTINQDIGQQPEFDDINNADDTQLRGFL